MCVSDTSCYDIPWLNRRLSLLTRLYWHSCSPRIVFTSPPLPFAPSILWTFCSKVQIIDNRIILVTGILGIQIQKEEVFNHSWNNFFFFRLKTMQNIRYHHLILVNISWNRSIRIIIISQCVIQRCVIIGIYIILVKLIFFIISDLQICIFTSSSDA